MADARISNVKALQDKILEQFRNIEALEQELRQAKEALMIDDTTSRVTTHETGVVGHERTTQPEMNLGREREYETGKDENRLAQMTEFNGTLNAITARVLSNAASYDLMVNQRAAHHAEIATNAQWNMPETAMVFGDALKASQGETTAQKALSVMITEAVAAGVIEAIRQVK